MYKLLSGAKAVKQYRGDENLPEAKNGMKNCGCKHPKKKYKYGTGALTIPEGSAIVTANGGKNKQALMAYKKGNYKLLNKIIDDMPEDNPNGKNQVGNSSTLSNDLYYKLNQKEKSPLLTETDSERRRYQELAQKGELSDSEQDEIVKLRESIIGKKTYDIYDDKRIAEKFGKKYDVDKYKYRSSLKGGKLNLIEDKENVKYRQSLRDPKVLEEQMKLGKVKIDDKGNISYLSQGRTAPNKWEFLGTSSGGTLPSIPSDAVARKPVDISTGTQISGEISGENSVPEKLENKRKGFNVPAVAEIIARASILGRGIEGVPENYLKLDRYRYESQLPKTLREIQLSEQAGRETVRDIVAGDAGRYLAQAGNLSASRMKVANEAVIQDTLARQDILNKNVDLGNVEVQTNRALKDQYAQQRAMARAAYDAQLIGLGQRIDSATETSNKMANQRSVDDIKLNLLKSKDYYMDAEGNIIKTKKGVKKIKTYKRK